MSRPGVQLLPPGELFNEEEVPELRSRIKLKSLSQEVNSKLFDILRPICKEPWAYVPAALAMLATLILLGGNLPIEIVEMKSYRVLVSVLLGLAVLLLIFVCTRLVLIWLGCKELLRRLEGVRLRRSFGLQEEFRWGTLWRMASNAGVLGFYQRVNREMECLEDLLKFEQQFYERVSKLEVATKEKSDATEAQALYYRAVGAICRTQESLRVLLEKWVTSHPQGDRADPVAADQRMATGASDGSPVR